MAQRQQSGATRQQAFRLALAAVMGIAGLIDLLANGDGIYTVPGLLLLFGAALLLAASRATLLAAGVILLLSFISVSHKLLLRLQPSPDAGGPWAPGTSGFIPGTGAFVFLDKLALVYHLVLFAILLLLWVQAWTAQKRKD